MAVVRRQNRSTNMNPDPAQKAVASLVAFAVVITAFPTLAQEYKAVRFGTDEQEATRKLNELAGQGWRYVGPLGNGLVAFQTTRPMSGPLAADTELKKLQGEWVYISREDDGQVTGYKDWILSISGKQWQEKYKNQVSFEGKVIIDDATSTPKTFTLKTTCGFPGGPATGFAIYEVEDDTLTYCIFNLSDDLLPGPETQVGPVDDSRSRFRPKTFDTKGKRSRVTFTLKRNK